MMLDAVQLTAIFGEGSVGDTAGERAATSDRLFVRSQMQLALASPSATGRVISAREALDSFGLPALRDVAAEGRSLIAPDPDEPARTIADRRNHLGFSLSSLAKHAATTEGEIIRAETPGRVSSIHVLQRIAEALSLDDRILSIAPGAGGDPKLGRRFRDIGGSSGLDNQLAGLLSEAAWVIRRQDELEDLLNDGEPTITKTKFAKRSDDYAFKTSDRGYLLAYRTRKLIGIDEDEPIASISRLAEHELRIPLIQGELGKGVVGATISNDGRRGIVLSNLLNSQSRSLFRRLTIAHELGHLLWDPDEHLLPVQIDNTEEMGSGHVDRLEEMRANAFAVALLAPNAAVRRINASAFSPSVALLEIVKRFGISAPAARFHLSNVCSIRLDDIALPKTSKSAHAAWHASEGPAAQQGEGRERIPGLRAGRFTDLVLHAVSRKLISYDTGASWLRCEARELDGLLEARSAKDAA